MSLNTSAKSDFVKHEAERSGRIKMCINGITVRTGEKRHAVVLQVHQHKRSKLWPLPAECDALKYATYLLGAAGQHNQQPIAYLTIADIHCVLFLIYCNLETCFNLTLSAGITCFVPDAKDQIILNYDNYKLIKLSISVCFSEK